MSNKYLNVGQSLQRFYQSILFNIEDIQEDYSTAIKNFIEVASEDTLCNCKASNWIHNNNIVILLNKQHLLIERIINKLEVEFGRIQREILHKEIVSKVLTKLQDSVYSDNIKCNDPIHYENSRRLDILQRDHFEKILNFNINKSESDKNQKYISSSSHFHNYKKFSNSNFISSSIKVNNTSNNNSFIEKKTVKSRNNLQKTSKGQTIITKKNNFSTINDDADRRKERNNKYLENKQNWNSSFVNNAYSSKISPKIGKKLQKDSSTTILSYNDKKNKTSHTPVGNQRRRLTNVSSNSNLKSSNYNQITNINMSNVNQINSELSQVSNNSGRIIARSKIITPKLKNNQLSLSNKNIINIENVKYKKISPSPSNISFLNKESQSKAYINQSLNLNTSYVQIKQRPSIINNKFNHKNQNLNISNNKINPNQSGISSELINLKQKEKEIKADEGFMLRNDDFINDIDLTTSPRQSGNKLINYGMLNSIKISDSPFQNNIDSINNRNTYNNKYEIRDFKLNKDLDEKYFDIKPLTKITNEKMNSIGNIENSGGKSSSYYIEYYEKKIKEITEKN